jgi:PAS domain S-box-containing protein
LITGPDRPAVPHLILFALGYLLSIWLGYFFSLTLTPGAGVILWPASGILLGTLLLTPTRHWPWWTLAGLPAETIGDGWLFGFGIPVSLPFFVGHVLGALAGAWLVRRWRGTPFHLTTVQDVLALALLAAGIGPILRATIASATVAVSQGNTFTESWPLWWTGAICGALIFAPLLVVIARRWREGTTLPHARWAEACVSGAVFLAALHIGLISSQMTSYLVVPPLLWLAIRFGMGGAVVASLVLALVTMAYASAGIGRFGEMASPEHMQLYAQTFIAVLALSALMIAALSDQRRRAFVALQDAREQLEARVLERTGQLRESQRQLLQALQVAKATAWQTDLSSGVFEFSEEALSLHGPWPRTAMSHEKALDVVHPDDRLRVQEALRRAWEHGASYRVEFRVHQPHGSTGWLYSQAEIREGPHGRRLVGLTQDITERKQTEEHILLLMREVNHRSKNLLTLVDAVARQTAGRNVQDFQERLEARIQALAACHNLLHRNEWKGVDLEELVHFQLAHFQDRRNERIAVRGPSLVVTVAISQTLGMALHELATNACKYGALSSPSGRVEINWFLCPDDGENRRFVMTWVESEGPPVIMPTRRGFGSTLIEDMTRDELNAEIVLKFQPSGLHWRLECAADTLVQSTP